MEKDLKKGKKNNSTRKLLVRILVVTQVILASIFNAVLLNMNLLPIKFDVLLIIAIVFFNVITWFSARKKSVTVLMSITSSMITAVIIVATVTLCKIDSTVDAVVADTDYEIVQMAAIVRNDSQLSNVNDIDGKTMGYMEEEQIDGVKEAINKKTSFPPQYTEYEDAIALTNALLESKEEIMLVNPATIDTIKEIEGYFDIESKIKTIHTFNTKVKKKNRNQNKKIDKEKFVVYISGSDTREGINTVGNSDVNILAAVNVKKGTVQLINTPRDYYVPVPYRKSSNDKLTHAGARGVETSMETLEDLYGVEVDYYFKINFTGFVSIIDELGGIDVYSDIEFTDVYFGRHYVQGYNHLNGEDALIFVRERKSFRAGDEQRGKNQMAAIKAVVQKIVSPEFLKKYDKVMGNVKDCFQTDIPSELIYSVINNQLDKNTKWEISTIGVSGMPIQVPYGSLKVWATDPYEEDVTKAKDAMQRVLEK